MGEEEQEKGWGSILTLLNTPLKMQKMEKTDIPGQARMCRHWCPHALLCKIGTTILENSSQYLKLCDPVIQPLGVHSTEMHSSDHPKTHIRMFTAALFLKAWNWKQSKRPSTADWIDDCRIFLHSGVLRSNEEWFITTCMNLTNTRLSGRGQAPKQNVPYDFIYIKHVNRQNYFMMIEIWVVVSWWGW